MLQNLCQKEEVYYIFTEELSNTLSLNLVPETGLLFLVMYQLHYNLINVSSDERPL